VDSGLLLLRVGFGATLALAHGLPKLLELPEFIASVEKRGIPLAPLTAPFAALSEFLGGVFLALGWFTRPAAVAVLSTMLVIVLHVHLHDPFKKQELALAYAVAALAVALAGPGRFSVEGFLRSRRQSESQATVAPRPPRDGDAVS
jgi:putative oxidoreductase